MARGVEDLVRYVSNCERFTGERPRRIVLSAKERADILLDARQPIDLDLSTFMGIPVVIEG